MNSVKLKPRLISIFTLLLSFGIMSGSFAQRTAMASRSDLVPSLQINNVQNLNGKYLHAIYAIQRAGFIGVTPTPNLDKIRSIQTQKVQTNNVVFSSLNIEKEPFRGSYNVVVFVVSDQPNIRWINPDLGLSLQYVYLSKVEKSTLDHFTAQQGESAVFGISL
jgi:hypothetical protein